MERMKALLFVLILPSLLLAQDEKGTIERVEITSPALESNLIGDSATRPLWVYLPPNYETSDKRYPVFYRLDAYGQDGRLLSTNVIDRLIQDGEIGEMVGVYLGGSNRFAGSFYINSSTNGDWGTYIVRDVVEYIDTHYRTISHRDSRGIDGFSMGGFGSMHLALKYPDVFSVVVAQSGVHDWGFNWGIPEELTWEAGATAFVDPQNWDEFDKLMAALSLSNMKMMWYALAAAFAPNPDKPPFFLDKPHELVDGEAQIVDEVFQKMVEKDNMRELDRYLSQPIRLKGIMIRHGKADGVVSVEQARVLSNRLTELGIDHVYEEHEGGHIFSSKRSLPFLSEKLSFEMPTNISTVTWGSVKAQR